MKKIIHILLCLMAALNICLTAQAAGKSPDVYTHTQEAPAFEELYVSNGICVILDKSYDHIEISASEKDLKRLVICTEDGIYRFSIKPEKTMQKIRNGYPSIVIRIPNRGGLKNVSVTSAAKVISENALLAQDILLSATSAAELNIAVQCEKCKITTTSAGEANLALNARESTEISASSAGNINGRIHTGTFSLKGSSSTDIRLTLNARESTVHASSASDIHLDGHCARVELSAKSGAEIDARKLESETAVAQASSGAEIDIRSNGTLTATATSGADIICYGDCTVHANEKSGGSVSKD